MRLIRNISLTLFYIIWRIISNNNIHCISKNNTKLLEFRNCCTIITDNVLVTSLRYNCVVFIIYIQYTYIHIIYYLFFLLDFLNRIAHMLILINKYIYYVFDMMLFHIFFKMSLFRHITMVKICVIDHKGELVNLPHQEQFFLQML